MRPYNYIFCFLAFIFSSNSFSQEIKWISLEDAVYLQEAAPRNIIIDMYTNWCGPCKLLDRNTFANKDVAKYINDNFYATDLFCTHEKVSLCDGFIDGDTIECPLHQGVFKISTGEVLESPPTEGLKTYDIKIEENFIFVDVN